MGPSSARAGVPTGARGRGGGLPLERALPPDVDIGDEEDEHEEGELGESEPAEGVELYGERVEEDDLDVEDDEEHRREVEAHREALGLHLALRDAGLEGDRAGPGAAGGALSEQERHGDHGRW